MLPKENRLTKKKDFEKVLKKGKGFKQKTLFLKAVENGLPWSRFGIIVSKKTAKRAVDRNKIKRQIREIIWRNIDRARKGYDLVFMAWPEIKDKSYEEKSLIVENSLKKIKFLEK
ncbi:MAG: ribonuclease P protein component [Candidatus Paceibacterota bacterium]|jgi:ribonuclease P protein component|nr:ribonuclease P protein component [Candidatus Paceibacterota bacterium]MDD4830828.1 ribonuclease P protein component [Candidatus Paceibacterota bacterium]MDD4874909.1 ribonuclease P protein component [Candidatus Paceibacterota bacterium]